MAIYVRLVGGLGNQLFQYACGFAQSERLDVPLILDTRELIGKANHDIFMMDRFDITGVIGDDRNLPPNRNKKIRYLIWRKFGQSPKIFREQGFALNKNIFDVPDDTYLHGYFLSENYFKPWETALRKELKLRAKPNAKNTATLNQIRQTQSVSLHVRRGDFTSLTAGSICNEAYYKAALEALKAKIGTNFELFIFSNDPKWVRKNLDFGVTSHVIDNNGPLDAAEDLRLMSACKHNMIANSSLSWWGAWLNQGKNKHVVGPKRWYPEKQFNDLEIIPDNWIKV